MHVGLNLVFLVPGETGGMETYARELIPALTEAEPDLRLTVFLGRDAAHHAIEARGNVRFATIPVHARRRADWVRGEQHLLPRAAKRHGVELLHSLASTAPSWGNFARVVTVHDLIYRIHPEAHGRLRARGMGVLVPLAARRSDRVIVPSASTRDDLTHLLRVSPEKIDVVPEGVREPHPASPEDVAALRARLGIAERPVVLTVSAKRPHKNVARLLEAIALIPTERRPVLILPGYSTDWEHGLRRRAEELGLVGDTRFLGWVDADELEALYAVASCFVFPSLYEGFGLPVLEAMARGVPVACSDRGSLPEVAGDAARLFDPEQSGAIADAIQTLLSDPGVAHSLIAAGHERAARFTWQETGRATVDVYRRTLAQRRRPPISSSGRVWEDL